MYIELRHLRSIRAIAQAGGVARAAEVLNVTQSALSHQIAGLEDQVGMALFARRSRPMTLSAAGMRLLRAAERILPEIAALEDEFAALHLGKTGRLHIAIQCHACFDWLFPVLELFRQSWPEVDVDIRAGLAFDSFPALLREEVDLVITSNPMNSAKIICAKKFQNRKKIITIAAKDGICRSFCAKIAPKMAGQCKGRRSWRRRLIS
jgi:LysR family transcriptional regulator for metE and metH